MYPKFLKFFLPPVVYNKLKVGRVRAVSKADPLKKQKPLKTKTSSPAPAGFFGWKRLAFVGISFLLAAKGQSKWIDLSDYHTINQGWIYFLAASALFILTLWPFKQDRFKNAFIPREWEIGFLFAIFGVAVFFRTYRLDQMPPGVFFDQGFEGWSALRILHEGWRPFWEEEPLHASAYIFYQLAAWFLFFNPSQVAFYLYFACLSLASLGLIYWTIRQIAGPRPALLVLYILAVMRWHINFTRNGFPSIQVPFYIFGTLAFLIYGFRTRKNWSFLVASTFFSLGFYTYQAYKVIPILLAVFGFYELWRNGWKAVQLNSRGLKLFALLFAILIIPFFYASYKNGNLGWREATFNIVSEVKKQHSIQPFVDMVTRTARMFNREGDNNERHNIPNYRMLDDVTGTLFVLGFFYSLLNIHRRKHYFAVMGFLVMTLPCVLSQDAAHANRMLGCTPFLAFLAAVPLVAVWGRVRQRWGNLGEFVFILVLAEPLLLMGVQNYNVYFNVQANVPGMWNAGLWEGYSVPTTRIGEAIARDGNQYDFYLFRNAQNDPTLNFLGYPHKESMKIMASLKDYAPFDTKPGRGICYVLNKDYEGLLAMFRSFYPLGNVEEVKSPDGKPIVIFFKIPPPMVEAARGLDGVINGVSRHIPEFPNDLPPGPYHAFFKGQVFLESFGKFQFLAQTKGVVSLKIAGRRITPNTSLNLPRGFYSLEADWEAPSGPADLKLMIVPGNRAPIPLSSGNLTTLPLNRGIKGFFYASSNDAGSPSVVEWDPVVNFTGGEDFAYTFAQLYAKWEGTLMVPKTGEYAFMGRTNEYGKVTVDGKTLFDFGPNKTGTIHLMAGPHFVRAYFRKVLGPAFTLLWKIPGSEKFTVISMEAFGETKPNGSGG